MDQGLLANDVAETFREGELRPLCARLGVRGEVLAGGRHEERVGQLVAWLAEQGRLAELVGELLLVRPYLAARYEADDPLSWLDRLGTGWGEATPPQITLNLAQLANPEAPRPYQPPPTEATPLRLVAEDPTWKWDSIRHPRLGATGVGPAPQLPLPTTNPFHPDAVLTKPRLFVGREDDLLRLQTRLQQAGSASLVGVPGIGKSALLRALRQQMSPTASPRWLFAGLDLQHPAYQTLPDVLHGALTAWLTELSETPVPPLRSIADFGRQVEGLAQAGYRPVLCLDHVDRVAERPFLLNEEVLETWLTLGQSGQLSFLTASRQPLAELWRRAGLSTALDPLFITLEVGLLADWAARTLLLETAGRAGIHLAPTLVTELLTWCGRQPTALLLAGATLVDGGQSHLPHLTATARAGIQAALTPQWEIIRQMLTSLQQSILSQPLQMDPPLVVARQYRLLAQAGVLQVVDGRYTFFSPAFAEWMQI